MKIKRLSIKNIASFEEADINFEGPELKAADVFLISGTVGAGKSTILDSIALALYGGTPRLSPDKRGANSNVERILRRNTVASEIKLEFNGNDGTPYLLTWERHRGHNRLDRPYQPVRRFLLANPGTPEERLFEKGELQPEIQRAVGLDFSDFCRTTMLAQGDFAAFLKASDEEKSRILEKLTGTVEYTLLGKKIYELSRAADDAAKTARDKAERFILLSPEQTAAIKENIAAEKIKDAAEQTRAAQVVKLIAWLQTEENLLKEEHDAAEALDKARAGKEAMKEAEALLEDWDKSADMRMLHRSLSAMKRELNDKENEMSSLRQNVLRLRGAELALADQSAEIEKKLQTKRAELLPLDTEAAVLDNALHYAALIDGVLDARNSLGKTRTALENAEKALAPAKEAATRAEENLERARRSENEVQQQIAALEAKAEFASLTENIRAESACKVRVTSLRELSSLRDELKKAEKDNCLEEESIRTTGEDLKLRRIAMEAKGKLLPDLKDAADKLESDWTKARSSGEEWAEKVRSTLAPGDICPVCLREIEQAFPDSREIYQTILAPIHDAWTKARDLYLDRKQELDNEDADIKLQEAIIGQRRQNLSQARDKETSLRRQIAQSESQLRITPQDDVAVFVDEEERRQKQIATLVAAGEEVAAQVRKQRQVLASLTDARKKAEEAEKQASAARQTAQQALSGAQARMEERRQALSDAEERLRREVGEYKIPGVDATPDSMEFKAQLLERASHRQDLKDGIEKLANARNTLDGKIKELRPVIESLSKLLPEEFTQDVAGFDPAMLEFNPTELHGQCAAHIRRVAELKDSIRQAESTLSDGMAEHEWEADHFQKLCALTDEEIRRLRDSARVAQVALDSARKHVADSGAKLVAHRAKEEARACEGRALSELNVEEEAIRERSRLIAETIGALNQQLQADADARAERERVLQEAGPLLESAAKWKRLSDLLGDSEGKVLRGIAQSYVLGGLISKANAYMKSLMPRYRLSGVSGTYEINVEDAYEGYTSRSARHISGGETFVVSLALALALADMGSGLRVDTLFIDEGFGNLSGEPLRAAVDTLRALRRSGGRRVGIISHIDSLRDTIPVQIRVEQSPGSSASHVTIV